MKDVIDRLTVLRGSGMPSLFSWSCKRYFLFPFFFYDLDFLLLLFSSSGFSHSFLQCVRSYKNGYVWNDLSENDVIHPAEGAEYVLKGSEVIEGCAG